MQMPLMATDTTLVIYVTASNGAVVGTSVPSPVIEYFREWLQHNIQFLLVEFTIL